MYIIELCWNHLLCVGSDLCVGLIIADCGQPLKPLSYDCTSTNAWAFSCVYSAAPLPTCTCTVCTVSVDSILSVLILALLSPLSLSLSFLPTFLYTLPSSLSLSSLPSLPPSFPSLPPPLPPSLSLSLPLSHSSYLQPIWITLLWMYL